MVIMEYKDVLDALKNSPLKERICSACGKRSGSICDIPLCPTCVELKNRHIYDKQWKKTK